MICPTCNTYPMVHPKDVGPSGPFDQMKCTGCKKPPESCTCEHNMDMEPHRTEMLGL